LQGGQGLGQLRAPGAQLGRLGGLFGLEARERLLKAAQLALQVLGAARDRHRFLGKRRDLLA
jgi:hypothetical protein